MDHLVGHWFDDEWVREGDGWAPATVSESSVRRLIGGCALLEDRTIYEEGDRAGRLLSLRGYDTERGRWRQLVFDPEGGVREWDLEEREDGWVERFERLWTRQLDAIQARAEGRQTPRPSKEEER